MHRESRCEHDIDEQETAVAEHLCPLCLDERIRELETETSVSAYLADVAEERIREMEAKVEAVARELVTDWRTKIPKLVLVSQEAADALESCAEELETRLNKEKSDE